MLDRPVTAGSVPQDIVRRLDLPFDTDPVGRPPETPRRLNREEGPWQDEEKS